MRLIAATVAAAAVASVPGAAQAAETASNAPDGLDGAQLRQAHVRAAKRLLPSLKRVRAWEKQQQRRRLQARTIPSTGDWQVAAALADRVFPGSRRWLLDCSASEGAWGPFVYNRQGSGAAGWLQYMPSTYRAWSPAAYREARRRGFIVDPATNSLYHPLGQALTGAYMHWRNQDHQWAGAGC